MIKKFRLGCGIYEALFTRLKVKRPEIMNLERVSEEALTVGSTLAVRSYSSGLTNEIFDDLKGMASERASRTPDNSIST